MVQTSRNDLVAGVDEAGRGPLAGPVAAAAVILNPKKSIRGLKDSKLLTPLQREGLFEKIRERALAWSVARATVAEIDHLNILQASLLAMQRAVERLSLAPHLVLIDGNQSPSLSFPLQTVVKGDQLEPAISAASIVAKVLRDRWMVLLDKKYPQYGFAKHKGYATVEHRKILSEIGPCRVHRKSFAPVAAFPLQLELGLGNQSLTERERNSS